MSVNQINIAFIDDIKLTRDGIITMLKLHNPNYNICIEASNGKEFIEILKSSRIQPDVAFIDIEMPVMNGIQTLRWIKKHQKNMKTIILSQELIDASIVDVIRLKGDGYLTKDIGVEILDDAIEVVMKNGKYYPEIIINRYEKVQKKKSIKASNISKYGFTDVELKYIKAASYGEKNETVADSLNVSIKTVEGYCNRVYKKMGVTNKSEMIIFAIKHHLVDFDKIPYEEED